MALFESDHEQYAWLNSEVCIAEGKRTEPRAPPAMACAFSCRRPVSAGRRGGVVMGRRVGLLVSLVALLALGGGLLAATPAWATPPKHFHIPINISFRDDPLSDACGFDVFDVLAGNVNVTLLYDQGGTLIREIDTGPTFTSSFTAPSTGKSIGSGSPAVLITDYAGGGALGTAAVARLTGLQLRLAPGVMFTGRQVFDAVVVDTSAEGSPSSSSPA